MKPFANKKISVNYKLKYILARIKNIVRKGENAGYC